MKAYATVPLQMAPGVGVEAERRDGHNQPFLDCAEAGQLRVSIFEVNPKLFLMLVHETVIRDMLRERVIGQAPRAPRHGVTRILAGWQR